MTATVVEISHQSNDGGIIAGLGRALRHRNYRLFFAGQMMSLLGTFLSQAAAAWLVFRLTHDAWLLGLVAFVGQMPMFLLTPLAGVWVDRVDRRRLMITTQLVSAVQSFGLLATSLVYGHNSHVAVPLVACMTVIQGLANAFDMPGRQAFLIEMINDRGDLPNAIALNSTMTHSARLLGPALAGLIISWSSESACFLLDGISYFAVIAALAAMTIAPRRRPPPRSVLHELRQGVQYAWSCRPIRVLLLLLCLLSLTGMPAMTILMPIFGDHFGGAAHGPQVFGFLSAASGLGALCGALYLAGRRTVIGLANVIAAAAVTFGLAMVLFSRSQMLGLSLLIATFAGWGVFSNFATANTLLQTLTDDDMRGRVMSFFSMAFFGMAPFGTLLVGFIARQMTRGGGGVYVGATRTFLIAGIAVIVIAGWFITQLPMLNGAIKPVNESPGVLPEVAEGLAAEEVLFANAEE